MNYIRDAILQLTANMPLFNGNPAVPINPEWPTDPYALALFSLCCLADPDAALDIGTGKGRSGMAIVLALHAMGKKLSCFTTFDTGIGKWTAKVPVFHKNLLDRYGIDIRQTGWCKADFKTLDAGKYIPDKGAVFLFYDIHDHHGGVTVQPDPSSPKLLSDWLPRIREGIVAVHDMAPVPAGYTLTEKDKKTHVSYSIGVHKKSGQWYKGYGECARIIDWLNNLGGQLMAVPNTSLVYFRVREGKPL